MKPQKILLKLFLGICILFSTGCSYKLLVSDKIDSFAPSQTTGIPYYLPQSMFQVNLQISDKNTEKLVKDKDNNIISKEDIRGYETTVKVTQKIIPDPKHLYLLKYDSSIWYNDEVDVRVSKDGFIQTVISNIYNDDNERVELGGESKDESNVELSNTFKANYEILKNPKKTESEQEVLIKQLGEDFEVLKGNQSFVFSVSNKKQTKIINNPFANGQLQVVFSSKRFTVEETAEENVETKTPQNVVIPEEFNDGIKFRLPYPFVITISLQYQDQNGKSIVLSEMNTIALLPDDSPIYTLPVERYALVHTAIAAEFKNGQFQNSKIKKVSPIYEILSLPKNIILEIQNLLEAIGRAINSPIGTMLGLGAAAG